MSWTAVLLIGWPLASLLGGPVIGRFVSQHMENTPKASEHKVLPAKTAPKHST